MIKRILLFLLSSTFLTYFNGLKAYAYAYPNPNQFFVEGFNSAGSVNSFLQKWENYINGFPKDPNKFPCNCNPVLFARFWNYYDHPDYSAWDHYGKEEGNSDTATFRNGGSCKWKVAINEFNSSILSSEFSALVAAYSKSYHYFSASFNYNVPGGIYEGDLEKCRSNAPPFSPNDPGSCPRVNVRSLPVVRVRVTCTQ